MQNAEFKTQNSKLKTVLVLAALAGLVLGALALTRSVALPLLPLGALWIWRGGAQRRWRHACVLLLAALLTIAPWTLRNALTYGGLILIDTTGPENLWLDNDPAGREAVKAQLYAMGDQRVARSALASARGMAALTETPGWVLGKSWREFRRFWALEHTDDLLDRPAIWVPPSEVWLRLILGDGLWLLVLLAGIGGLLLLPVSRWLRAGLGLWVLYTVLTGALFHVEYRYRLPLLPVLLPCAAWLLARVWGRWRSGRARSRLARLPIAAALLMLLLLTLTLTFRPYASEALRLGHKHWLLAQAEAALRETSIINADQAQAQAAQALQLDQRSVLARVLLARVDLARGQPERANPQLQAAIAQLPAHPYAHLLLGDLLRAQADPAARRELAFETASGEDLQAWARARLTQTPLTTTLDLGGGLDLGFIGGFHAAEDDGTRWTTGTALIMLAPPTTASALVLRVAAQRPAGVALPELVVAINGIQAGRFGAGNEWGEISVPLPSNLDRAAPLTISLRPTTTFVPHASDRTSPDGRDLGIRLDWAELR
ncbi:MAG: glycosyl transferase [Herpetosiphonaceae bacterium]|nr:glycosyl transferase [Herpetosiphonaceae bacterium]